MEHSIEFAAQTILPQLNLGSLRRSPVSLPAPICCKALRIFNTRWKKIRATQTRDLFDFRIGRFSLIDFA
jgi:hypothetical protein